MAQLSMAERRDLIGRYIDKAKVNWAHLGIAQLMKHRIVDRVLTVNFDPLLVRACALVGVFPGIYDFAASQYFNRSFISSQAVFHLHGQRSGLVVLNTTEEVRRLSTTLEPVFNDSINGRVCIVVGYSGENDPVFTQLTRISSFDNNLYWVCFKDSDPPSHVSEKLLVQGNDAFQINGFDADDFFVRLAQELDCFPPDFVGRPFSHLAELIGTVTAYSLPGHSTSVIDNANTQIADAIERFEGQSIAVGGEVEPPSSTKLVLKARNLLVAGKFEEVILMSAEYDEDPTTELAEVISLGYIGQAGVFYEEAKKKSGDEADRLFELASENCELALTINPGKYETLNNWGIVLSGHAKTKSGGEADQLFAQANEKYEAALRVNPQKHEAFRNFGISLTDQAQTKEGEEAEVLLAQAREQLEAADQIRREIERSSFELVWADAADD
jgi:hypothetical protein